MDRYRQAWLSARSRAHGFSLELDELMAQGERDLAENFQLAAENKRLHARVQELERPWVEIVGTAPGVIGYTLEELRSLWAGILDDPEVPHVAKRLACMAVGLANQRERLIARVRDLEEQRAASG